MPSNPQTTATPPKVAAQATEKGVLKRDGVALIGIFGPGNAPNALLLMRNGSTETASVGDRTKAGTVLGIDESGIILQQGGKTVRLTMPG